MKKLKKILLINWLYFDRELIEVGDVNFLTGRNGAGKSTVIDALQIVLLGETNARNFNLAANERSQLTSTPAPTPAPSATQMKTLVRAAQAPTAARAEEPTN